LRALCVGGGRFKLVTLRVGLKEKDGTKDN